MVPAPIAGAGALLGALRMVLRACRMERGLLRSSGPCISFRGSRTRTLAQGGTRRGLRNLLTSLDKVLWEGAVWKCTSLADVSTDAHLKKWLNKARLLLHTDKMARQPEKIRLRAELILIEIDKALKGVA